MALAITDVNRSTWTHDKIVFSARSLGRRRFHTETAFTGYPSTPSTGYHSTSAKELGWSFSTAVPSAWTMSGVSV